MKMKCKIDIDLVPIRASYCILLIALATLMPYLPLFMTMLNISSNQLAIIFGFVIGISSPIRLLIGYIADKTRQRKMTYVLCCILSSVFFLAMYFVESNEDALMKRIDGGNKSWELRHEHINETHTFTNEDVVFNVTVIANNSNSTEEAGMVAKCRINELNDSENSKSKDDLILNFTSFAPSPEGMYNVTLISDSINLESYLTNAKSESLKFKYCQFAQPGRSVYTSSFWILFILYFFAQSIFSPVLSMIDSLIYSHLGNLGRSDDFGKSRLWGTIGFGICGLFTTGIMNVIPKHWGRYMYLFNFTNFTVCMVLAGLIVLIFFKDKTPTPDDNNDNNDNDNNNNDNNNNKNNDDTNNSDKGDIKMNGPVDNVIDILDVDDELMNTVENSHKDKDKVTSAGVRGLMETLCSFYLLIILFSCLVAGFLAGPFEAFFYIFLSNMDPDNQLVMGVCLLMSSIGEVILLYFSPQIMGYLGKDKCLYITFITYMIRYIGSSLITNVWYAVITEASQSICFAMFFPTVTSWATSLTGKEYLSTVQCFIGAIYFSLGRAAGAGLSGRLEDLYGFRVMFQIFSGVAGVYLIILIILFEVVDRMRKKRMKKRQCNKDVVDPDDADEQIRTGLTKLPSDNQSHDNDSSNYNRNINDNVNDDTVKEQESTDFPLSIDIKA